LKIMVDKEALEALYERTEANLDYALSALNFCVLDDSIKTKLDAKFHEILYYLGQVYNPELAELKRQARTYYQKWLNLKDKDKSTAAAVYLEYVTLKCKIDSFDATPF